MALRLKNPAKFKQTEQEQLFEGQTNHPLTQDEWNDFYEAVDFDSFPAAEQTKIREAFTVMGETEAGREQIRRIAEANPTFSDFEIKRVSANEMGEGFAAQYSTEEECVELPPSALKMDSRDLGNALLHELGHARQGFGVNIRSNPSKVFSDLETQAFTSQVNMESGSKLSDPIYKKNYEANLAEWREIAAGKRDLTGREWVKENNLEFKYKPQEDEYLFSKESQERQAQAREMWARQMASQETRGQYMNDFYASREDIKEGEISSHSISYQGMGVREVYNNQDQFNARTQVIGRRKDIDFVSEHSDMEALKDLHKEYPAFDLNKAADSHKERMNERNGLFNEDGSLRQYRDTDENVTKQLEEIEKNPRLSALDKAKKTMGVCYEKRDKMNPDHLQNVMLRSLSEHAREAPNAIQERNRMLDLYNKATGSNLPHELPAGQTRAQAEKGVTASNRSASNTASGKAVAQAEGATQERTSDSRTAVASTGKTQGASAALRAAGATEVRVDEVQDEKTRQLAAARANSGENVA